MNLEQTILQREKGKYKAESISVSCASQYVWSNPWFGYLHYQREMTSLDEDEYAEQSLIISGIQTCNGLIQLISSCASSLASVPEQHGSLTSPGTQTSSHPDLTSTPCMFDTFIIMLDVVKPFLFVYIIFHQDKTIIFYSFPPLSPPN